MSNSHQPFLGKTIALGICGGIAAYKACDLIRELYRRGAKAVTCLMTKSAEEFITPTSLQALSRQPVYRYDASVDETGLPIHIKIAQEADLLVIIPATVNTIAKCAQGLADDLLSTTFMTFTDKPVLIVPAMNTRMWQHPIFQSNLDRLTSLTNVQLASPTSGLLACGETGDGHLAPQETLLQHAYKLLHPHHNTLSGLNIIITAGGTAEAIDPVRCISNHSSGKMGLALADEAWAMGANVTLLSSKPVTDRAYTIKPFSDTQSLHTLLDAHWPKNDWLLMAAAVSDFYPAQKADKKIKKNVEASSLLNLTLLPNVDLLENLGQHKMQHQRLVGFAAESHDVLESAFKKIQRKNLDAIIANDISRDDIGFQADDNEVTLLFADGSQHILTKAPKPDIAQKVLRGLHQAFTLCPAKVLPGELPKMQALS